MGKVTRVSRSLYEFTNNDDCIKFVWHLRREMERTGGMTLAVIESSARMMFKKDFESTFINSDDWRDRIKVVKPEDIKYKKWGESYSTLNLGVESDDNTTIDDFRNEILKMMSDFYMEFTNNHPHLKDEISSITIVTEVYEGRVCDPTIYKEVE